MSPELLTLTCITFVAATINGALGYGFSSITVPLALFFFTNRVLNPALVLLESSERQRDVGEPEKLRVCAASRMPISSVLSPASSRERGC